MYLPAILAALHHFAAFTVVATLAIEIALVKPPLSLAQVQRLQRVDLIFGAAATVVLIVGLARVTWFEKGPAYYWHDVYFLGKFIVFCVAALISIYPTVSFFSWAKTLGAARDVAAIQGDPIRRVRLCLMLELAGIVLIISCAALMARGFGFLS